MPKAGGSEPKTQAADHEIGKTRKRYIIAIDKNAKTSYAIDIDLNKVRLSVSALNRAPVEKDFQMATKFYQTPVKPQHTLTVRSASLASMLPASTLAALQALVVPPKPTERLLLASGLPAIAGLLADGKPREPELAPVRLSNTFAGRYRSRWEASAHIAAQAPAAEMDRRGIGNYYRDSMLAVARKAGLVA